MTFYLALASAIASALSLVLHAFGAKSPTAEKIAEDVDAADKLIPKN